MEFSLEHSISGASALNLFNLEPVLQRLVVFQGGKEQTDQREASGLRHLTRCQRKRGCQALQRLGGRLETGHWIWPLERSDDLCESSSLVEQILRGLRDRVRSGDVGHAVQKQSCAGPCQRAKLILCVQEGQIQQLVPHGPLSTAQGVVLSGGQVP